MVACYFFANFFHPVYTIACDFGPSCHGRPGILRPGPAGPAVEPHQPSAPPELRPRDRPPGGARRRRGFREPGDAPAPRPGVRARPRTGAGPHRRRRPGLRQERDGHV